MMSVQPIYTWEEAGREFLYHVEATMTRKTLLFYKSRLDQLFRWAEGEGITFGSFGKRHLDRYLAHRKGLGRKPTTLHHDGVCTKAFLTWCSKNDFLDRNPLSDYQIRSAPKPPKHMPTDEEMRSLLTAVRAFWDPAKNPASRRHAASARAFYRDRNYALVLGLLDTACRIGEMLSLKVDDVKLKERQLLIRETKGREPRALPISGTLAEALDVWLKVRGRTMRSAGEDGGWLFITSYGERMHPEPFLVVLKNTRDWAGLPKGITLHSLRRFSLNKLAKHNLLMAQQIAGHKSPETTLIYTKLDPEFVRAAHADAAVVGSLLDLRRESKRPRRKLV